MIQELTTAIASIKTSTEIAKGILSLKSDVAKNQAVIDIQNNLLGLQGIIYELNEKLMAKDTEIEELRIKLSRLNDWDGVTARYELKQFNGSVVYVLKQEYQTEEPIHMICPSCFGKNEKSILQARNISGRFGQDFVCISCNSIIQHIPVEIAGGVSSSAGIYTPSRNPNSRNSWMSR